jgi:hypothetical protein
MKLYAQFKVSSAHTKILCPLCREDWGPMAIHVINEDCKGKASLRKSCATASCSACTFQVRGPFFRCVECSMFGLPSGSSKKNTQNIISNALIGSSPAVSNASQLLCVTSTSGPLVVQQQQEESVSLVGVVLDEKMMVPPPRPSHAPVDFCQKCFLNVGRDHSKHHFLTSSSNAQMCDYMWESARNPRAPQHLFDAQMLASLQNREFGDEDYDLLLSLDRPHGVTVQTTLVDSHPVFVSGCDGGAGGVGCWCGVRGGSEGAAGPCMRLLPCKHTCHDDCLKVKLDEALSEGAWKLDEITCGHAGCDLRLYIGISRRRAKKKSADGAEADGNAKGTSASDSSACSSLLCGISGMGIGSGSVGSEDPSAAVARRGHPEAVVRRAGGGTMRPPRSSSIQTGHGRRSGGDEGVEVHLEVGSLSASGSLIASEESSRHGASHPPPRPVKGSTRHFMTPAMRKGLVLAGQGQGGAMSSAEQSEGRDLSMGSISLHRSASMESSGTGTGLLPDNNSQDQTLRRGGRADGAEAASVASRRSLSASRAERVRPTAAFAPSSTGAREGVRSAQVVSSGGVDEGLDGSNASLLCGVGIMQQRSSSQVPATSISQSRSRTRSGDAGGAGTSDVGGIATGRAGGRGMSHSRVATGGKNSRIAKGRPSLAISRLPLTAPAADAVDLQLISSSASQEADAFL